MKVKRTNIIKTNNFRVGDIISFKLTTGEKVEAMAVEDRKECMVFILVDCLAKEYPMNSDGSIDGGYENSELRKTLNTEILSTFSKKIRSCMIPFDNGDCLTIPEREDIFGDACWTPMRKRKNRLASQGKNNDPECYWLRDVVSSATFALVSSHGLASAYYASNSLGVRPVFAIVKEGWIK